jgi:dephospho-CoA kinase
VNGAPARLRVGVTGGVASGKSAVCRRLAGLGVPVVDADIVAREVVQPGEPALAEVVARFGEAVLGPDGELDRSALRARVFADAGERRALETILHPRIRERMRARADAAAGPYVVLAIPLLAESGADYSWLDAIVVVDAPEAVQLQRLIARDGVDAALARAMIAAQAPRERRLALAQEVIDNSGTLSDLHAAVDDLHRRLLDRARRRAAPPRPAPDTP